MSFTTRIGVGLTLVTCLFASAGERINHAGRILPNTPTISTPTLFNTAAGDAIISSLQILPRDNAWNEDISRRPVLANSDAMITRIISEITTTPKTLRAFYEMNYVIVPSTQTKINIVFDDYPDESDPPPYPIPSNMPVEGWPKSTGNTLTQNQTIDDGSDRHSIIVDPGNNKIYETWRTLLSSGVWHAANGARFDLNTNNLRPAGWTSGDAAGLSMFAGLVRYDECQRGEIEHAIRCIVKHTRAQYIYPATHYASNPSTTDPDTPAMGQRLRLKSSFVVPATWTKEEKAVCAALKKYGCIVADNGSFFSISVAPDDRFVNNPFSNLSTMAITNFEVIQTTGATAGPRSPGAPTVDVGADQTVPLGSAANLNATVTGTGLTLSWYMYSGPGTVTFGNASSASTTANFSVAGTYTLMLKADDTVHTPGYDALVVTVTSGGPPQPTVALSLSGSPIAEASGQATVTATLSNTYTSTVTVNLGYSGTAAKGTDYSAPSSITIPAGSLTGTATITATQDSIDEPNETVIVDITGVTNGTESGTQQVTATITDDDAAPTVTLSLAGSPIAEASGSATVTAALSAVSAQTVTVNLGYSGTATRGTDYNAPLSITIAAGSLTGAATLAAIQDSIDEPSETIIVDITSVTNGTESGTQQVTATITDDDATPTVTLSLTGSPIAEAGGTATLRATLSAVSGQAVTVNLGYSGTAANGADYSGPASITIPAGSSSATGTITAISDAAIEVNETIIIDITSVTNGVESGTQQVTAIITDDDGVPSVTLSLTGSPIAEASGSATVTATLSAASAQTVTVNLGYSGTATNGTDYTASASITITAGSLTGTATITATQDSIDEPNETVIVDISSVTNAAESGTQQVTATITDDDAAPTVTLSLTGSPIAEAAGVATVRATLSAVSSQAVTVNLGYSGTATLGTDYTAPSSITIPAGSTSATASLTVIQDAIDESNETIVVDITSVTNGTESGTQQVTATITDDDPAPTVTLSLTGSPLAEASGSATVRATLSAVSGQAVTVNLGFSGTATRGTDYNAPISITIPAGNTSATATLQSINDTIYEGNETIVVDIISVTNGSESGTQQVTATITDDDKRGNGRPKINSLSYSPTAPKVGDTVAFTVAASDPDGDPTTTTFDYGDGTVASNTAHAWSNPGDYTVTVSVGDNIDPATVQTLLVTVSPNGTGGGGGGGVITPGADSDGDGVSDENEVADGTDPFDAKSFLKLPMTLLSMSGKVSFTSTGHDGCSISGIIPGIAPKTNFGGTLLKVDAGGATEVFSLSDKGRGATPNGTATLRLKFTTDPATRQRQFTGGDVPFKITLKAGTWSDEWADEGVTAAGGLNSPVTINVDLTIAGRVYTASMPTLFSGKAGVSGKFRN